MGKDRVAPNNESYVEVLTILYILHSPCRTSQKSPSLFADSTRKQNSLFFTGKEFVSLIPSFRPVTVTVGPSFGGKHAHQVDGSVEPSNGYQPQIACCRSRYQDVAVAVLLAARGSSRVWKKRLLVNRIVKNGRHLSPPASNQHRSAFYGWIEAFLVVMYMV
jgi:hypothetical protein